MNFFKTSWKAALTIITALGIITALAAFNAHYASSEDLQKVKVETTAAIQEMKKSMQLDRDIARLNSVTDNLMKSKIQSRQYPRDVEIKEDIKSLQLEKEKIQERIEKR